MRYIAIHDRLGNIETLAASIDESPTEARAEARPVLHGD